MLEGTTNINTVGHQSFLRSKYILSPTYNHTYVSNVPFVIKDIAKTIGTFDCRCRSFLFLFVFAHELESVPKLVDQIR